MNDLTRIDKQSRIFLIFQMAKVASRSWYQLLSHNFPDAMISHFHVISTKRTTKYHELAAAKPPSQTIKHLVDRGLSCPDARATEFIEEGCWVGPPATIITGVRDPVARAISAVTFLGDRYGYERLPIAQRDNATPENVLEVFHRALAVARGQDACDDTFVTLLAEMIGSYDLWLEEELSPAFGFNFESVAFDRNAGAILLDNIHKALVYRMEDLKVPLAHERLMRTASMFIGKSLSHFPSPNQGNETRYQAFYKQVVSQLCLSDDELDWFYNNDTVKKFYTEEEVGVFRKRWS
ncbi:hypothetical protein F9L33_04075 [Amylibacter sp. SFDW26]|uniref:hypothetical protein n=1 Tax=Amylibacter sp. SFDW26 TaxID=2652722 RepID=UPI001261E31E|nr:hypothetical protein [Amylibacter sp. SFDW26]KAB7615948.1 hypothetical protein F9L33_04075 [Amylibacter sp. SFDW26]